jgi:hypothetical protein
MLQTVPPHMAAVLRAAIIKLTTKLRQNVRTYGQQHSSVYGDVTSETDFRPAQVNGSQEGVNLKRNNGLTFLFP